MKLMSKEMKVLYIGLTAVTLVLLVATAGAAITGYTERGVQLRKLKVELEELQDTKDIEISKLEATVGAYRLALQHARNESSYVEDTQYNRRRLAQELYEVGGFEGRAWDSYLAVKFDAMQDLAKDLNISLEEVGKCVTMWVHKDVGFGGHKRLMTEWFVKIYTTQDMQEYIRFCKSAAGKKHQIKQYKEITMAVVFIEKKGASRKAQRQLRARLVEAALKK